MSYVIATWKEGMPHAITACNQSNSFQLIPLDSDVALNKIFSHPYRAGAQQVLTWINKNDEALSVETLSIQEIARFSK
jgi:hypothetical protein